MLLLVGMIVGTCLMFLVVLVERNYYSIPVWKAALLTVILAVVGLFGTKVMSFVESGSFQGTSYYGAVLLVPLGMALAALVLRLPCLDVLDICAPAECIMLAVMKIRCMLGGCCYGIQLFETENGIVRFPSRIVELIVSLILMYVLVRMSKQEKFRGELYGWYFLLYGIVRFILQWFRGDLRPVLGVLSSGHIWSILSVCLGLVWIGLHRKLNSAGNDTYGAVA